MTHHSLASLLEDYVDKELSPEDVVMFERLLAEDDALGRDVELTRQLKDILSKKRTYDPGEAYFDEVSTLILARVENAGPAEQVARSDASAIRQRRLFVRSMVSAAASLFLFFTAILIGSQDQSSLARISGNSTDMLVAASVVEQLPSVTPEFVTAREESNISRGLLLLGPPGVSTRLIGLTDLALNR